MNNPTTDSKAPLVLVTGATRGLGLAIAQRLLEANYRVIGTGRRATLETEQLCATWPGRFVFEPLDLAQVQDLHAWVRTLVTTHGQLYGLVNNAALGNDGVLATMHETQIADMIRVNVEAPILLAKYCSRSMLLQRKGRIVNISSIIASTGFSGLSVYAATKAAMVGFTRSLSRELGKAGITVNAVAPGYMRTDMTAGLQDEKLATIQRRSPLGRLATTGEVAGAVAYLLSADGESITGTTLTVDAGSTA